MDGVFEHGRRYSRQMKKNDPEISFDPIEKAINDLSKGRMVIVVDDECRENEGDLVAPAINIAPEQVNFMVRNARGLICVPITSEQAERLDLKPMVFDNTERHGTAFTVSADAKEGTTTGISAFDRAITARTLADPGSKSNMIAKPGHMFPLIAKKGGVLKRAGHTEASVDLVSMAGFAPAAVICEIMNPDGTMARLPELAEFAKNHDLSLVTIEDLINYRSSREMLVKMEAEVDLPSAYGDFKAYAYRDLLDEFGTERLHIALVKGETGDGEDVLVRVHSECLTGDVFGSLRCDCGPQLHTAMAKIDRAGRGVILYMRQEGRGIGLLEKLKAYNLQEKGLDTVEANEALGHDADLRNYGLGAQILKDLGIKSISLMTNNPKKIVGLQGYGIEIKERVPLEIDPNEHNMKYLMTKREKMGHLLHLKDIIK